MWIQLPYDCDKDDIEVTEPRVKNETWDCDYDKQNISIIICDTDIPYDKQNISVSICDTDIPYDKQNISIIICDTDIRVHNRILEGFVLLNL
jgi:hypothetical protein